MSRSCLVIRVFTRGDGGGNHLGIVEDIRDLTTERMQAIAVHLGFSETIFVEPGEIPLIRIFTPQMELPFAGHPLVGAAWLMLQRGSGIDRLRCGIGEVQIRQAGDVTWVDVPMSPSNATPDTPDFAARVGFSNPVSTWRVTTPLDYRMVELATAAEVSAAQPDTSVFAEVHGLTVFARDGQRVRMRFFIPVAGINEDPATGSAAVALATALAARGEAAGTLTIDQGEEIGHPSRINLSWSGNTASIGGTVSEDESRELSL